MKKFTALERPRFFARAGMAQQDHYSFRRTPTDEMVAREVNAVRKAVGIMDITAFTKLRVSGAGAGDLLDRLAANKLPEKYRRHRANPFPESSGAH